MLWPWDRVYPWGLGCSGGLLLSEESTCASLAAEEWAWGMAGFGGAAPLSPEPHESKWEGRGKFSEGKSVISGNTWPHWGNLGPERYEQLGLMLPDFSSVSPLLSLDKISLISYLQDLWNTYAESFPAEASLIPIKDFNYAKI